MKIQGRSKGAASAGITHLHAYELRPTILLGAKLQLRKLIRPHARSTDITDLAALHEVMESLHSLLDRHSVVEAVDLEQVEVRRVEALQRGLDLVEDGRPPQPVQVLVVLGRLEEVPLKDVAALGILGDGAVALAENDDLLPRNVILLQRFSDDLFAHTVRVNVGGVPRVEALVVGLLQEWQCLERISG